MHTRRLRFVELPPPYRVFPSGPLTRESSHPAWAGTREREKRRDTQDVPSVGTGEMG
jgi:hypothetical protein